MGGADGVGAVLSERQLIVVGRQRQPDQLTDPPVVINEEYAWPDHDSIRSLERDVRRRFACAATRQGPDDASAHFAYLNAGILRPGDGPIMGWTLTVAESPLVDVAAIRQQPSRRSTKH